MRIVQLMTDRSRYFNPSKNYWFSFNAFLISLIGLYFRCLSFRVVLVNTARPNFFHTFLCRYPRQMQRLLQINCHYIFLLICYFCILMYNIPTHIFTDLYLKSKRQHFRVFVYKSNLYFFFS